MKRSAPKNAELRGAGREVLAYVLNRIAFANYDECCSALAIATALEKDPKRFRTTLLRLADAGWLTLHGSSRLRVYPTVAALRWADRSLSLAAARRLLQRVTTAKTRSR